MASLWLHKSQPNLLAQLSSTNSVHSLLIFTKSVKGPPRSSVQRRAFCQHNRKSSDIAFEPTSRWGVSRRALGANCRRQELVLQLHKLVACRDLSRHIWHLDP